MMIKIKDSVICYSYSQQSRDRLNIDVFTENYQSMNTIIQISKIMYNVI